MTSPFRLDDKVALITGSSRGIGLAIAQAMAEQGAKVVISSRKMESCEEAAATIRARRGVAAVIPCNVSRKEEVEALVKGTRNEFGKIDIVVGNAAANPAYGPLGNLSDEAFDKIIGTNVKSNLWLCNLTIPEMAERGGGAVVLVSSIGGLRGSPVIGSYCISKAADLQLARNLAVELGPHNIRINCIAPGLVKTDFARALWDTPAAEQRSSVGTPLRRLGEPDDIAGAAVFLAAKSGGWMTGQTIVVDGGSTS